MKHEDKDDTRGALVDCTVLGLNGFNKRCVLYSMSLENFKPQESLSYLLLHSFFLQSDIRYNKCVSCERLLIKQMGTFPWITIGWTKQLLNWIQVLCMYVSLYSVMWFPVFESHVTPPSCETNIVFCPRHKHY